MFVLLHLSYAVPAWAPYTKADIVVLERVQKRAVMMVTNVRGCYEERLASLKLRSLEERRVRGDLIETYKILSGKSQVNHNTWFNLANENDWTANTRFKAGYLNLSLPTAPQSEIRRNLFSHCVVPIWNQLPDFIKQAETTNQFKNIYDKHSGY